MSNVPVFGEDFEPAETVEFKLVVIDSTKAKHRVHFRGRKQISGGAFMQIGMAADDMALMRAYVRIILEACDDQDGLPLSYKPPKGSPSPETVPEEERNNPEHGIDPRIWDKDQWSSRRRFSDIVGSAEWFVPMEGLEKLAEWLLENAAERPTWKPSRLSRGPAPTAATSAAV